MPNPVDDAPVQAGHIALPLDTDPSEQLQPTEAARLRKFRRRVFYVVVVCCTLTLVAFMEHPPLVRRPVDELARTDPLIDIAADPRLEPYQTPDSADYCAEWTPGADNLASASFELPTAADLLFFLSRGPLSGHISIDKTPTYSTGPVEVNVTAEYHRDADLERTKVCRMGGANQHGLLLWAGPRHPHGDPTRDVRFNITVGLPSGVRNYKDLTTDLALSSHSVGDFFDIWSPTSFDDIRLKTSNAAVDFGSLVGSSAFIQTTNAKVQGFFGGFELGVQTANAPIKCTAMMFAESAGSESRVNLTTSNGAISTNIGLVSDHSDNILRAGVHTSGASLTIGTPRSMMARNASFFLDASTSVGPATLALHPEFEGTYDLQTTGARARVQEGEDTRDPAGKGRHRTVTKTSTGRHARGEIYWSEEGRPVEERGAIRITTTVSPVQIDL
ncbi:hypothetical protein DFH06DRAFT_1295673 [Mycena polygramma]|nr:hypothetical protein DFH06DRAFT_1295673 [Mycena polygramma]